MRFSLLGQAALVSMATLGCAAENSCDEGPFAGSKVAGPAFPGGNDPETNCDSRWSNGEIIVGIEAWSARFQLKAVRFKYSRSGWGPVRGQIPDDEPEAHAVKEWGAAEEVGIKLWNNKPDDGDPMDAVGRIIITQGGNTIFEVGANGKKTGDEVTGIDNGAGLILGAKTRSGAWLSSLEFKMLKSKVMKAELIDVQVSEKLEDWNEKQKGIDHVNLKSVYFVNDNVVGGPNLTYTFANTDSRQTSKSISSQRTNQWSTGVSVTVGGGVEIPFLAKAEVSVETSFQYQRTNMDGEESSESRSQDLSYSIGAAAGNFLPPQRAAQCESWAVSGKFESGYTGVIEATLADGSKYTFADEGDVSTVGWVKAATTCKEIDIKDVPQGAETKPAEPMDGKKRAVVFRG